MSCITVVQISDLHIHSEKDKTLDFFEYIANAICREPVESELILVLVSGDIAFSGTEEEYGAIEPVFSKLAQDLSEQFKSPVKWIMVPGNHDGTFQGAQKTRSHVISGILKEGSNSIDESVIDACVAPQKHYFSFESKFCSDADYLFKDKLLGIKEFKVSEKTISFWELNASWMSRVPEQQGNLVFPVERYQDNLQMPVDFRFTCAGSSA